MIKNIVLVRPKYSFNVGSTARVMANMGADRLILIEPLCEIDHQARQGAAGAQMKLLEADIYKSWADFFSKEGDGLRLAFCGKTKKQIESADWAAKKPEIMARAEEQNFRSLFLIFGTEDDGLADTDLEYAHFILNLPTFGEFQSLNLSHAVLLALYILGEKKYSGAPQLKPEEFYFPESSIKEWLMTLGFDLENRDTSAYTVLKRLFLSRLANAKELRILEAVIHQTLRKLKKNN